MNSMKPMDRREIDDRRKAVIAEAKGRSVELAGEAVAALVSGNARLFMELLVESIDERALSVGDLDRVDVMRHKYPEAAQKDVDAAVANDRALTTRYYRKRLAVAALMDMIAADTRTIQPLHPGENVASHLVAFWTDPDGREVATRKIEAMKVSNYVARRPGDYMKVQFGARPNGIASAKEQACAAPVSYSEYAKVMEIPNDMLEALDRSPLSDFYGAEMRKQMEYDTARRIRDMFMDRCDTEISKAMIGPSLTESRGALADSDPTGPCGRTGLTYESAGPPNRATLRDELAKEIAKLGHDEPIIPRAISSVSSTRASDLEYHPYTGEIARRKT